MQRKPVLSIFRRHDPVAVGTSGNPYYKRHQRQGHSSLPGFSPVIASFAAQLAAR
jgi:hypothetical protein